MNAEKQNNNIPIFTPPSEEQRQFNGPSCYYHKDEPAVANCARCGKDLCRDCCDSYGVSAGKYAGKHLCYDRGTRLKSGYASVTDPSAESDAQKDRDRDPVFSFARQHPSAGGIGADPHQNARVAECFQGASAFVLQDL